MKAFGIPSNSTRISAAGCELAYLDKFHANDAERLAHKSDEATPALLRIIQDCVDNKLSVTLLTRKNSLPSGMRISNGHGNVSDLVSYEEHLRSFFPEEERHRISTSTMHGYKGKESDVVVILDVIKGSIPFIHPHWHFYRVFGDNLPELTEDERRLFYVAITRAKRRLVLLTETGRESEFLNGLLTRVSKLDWNKLPTQGYESANGFVEVENGYGLKDVLKIRGFHFDRRRKVWSKEFGVDGEQSAKDEATELARAGYKAWIVDGTGSRSEV
jgi:hypothetical protein